MRHFCVQWYSYKSKVSSSGNIDEGKREWERARERERQRREREGEKERKTVDALDAQTHTRSIAILCNRVILHPIHGF